MTVWSRLGAHEEAAGWPDGQLQVVEIVNGGEDSRALASHGIQGPKLLDYSIT